MPGEPIDLADVRRGLEAMPAARAVLQRVRPSRVEAFGQWAAGEPDRARAVPVVLSALSTTLDVWPEWRGLDEGGRRALALRLVGFLDGYRTLRGRAPDLDDVGRSLASVLGPWASWQGLDEEGRRSLARALGGH